MFFIFLWANPRCKTGGSEHYYFVCPLANSSLARFVSSCAILQQSFVKEKLGADADERPCIFVFHGGSGSSEEDIATAVKVREGGNQG